MITSAACRTTVNNENVTIKVHRHCDFFEIMKLLHCQYDKNKVEQGFIEWDGKEERFVSRREAAQIAIKCNQILPYRIGEFDSNCLYSEDCW